MLLVKMVVHAIVELRDLLFAGFIAEKIVLFTIVIAKMVTA